MNLVIVRHGIAVDREVWAQSGSPEDERPLTPKGKTKMEENAKALRTIVSSLDIVLSSPLRRAVQTAAILCKQFPTASRYEQDLLRPESDPVELLQALAQYPHDYTVALVGHEPHLSTLIARTIGRKKGFTELKKGGVAILQFEGRPRCNAASLTALVSPAILKNIVRSKSK